MSAAPPTGTSRRQTLFRALLVVGGLLVGLVVSDSLLRFFARPSEGYSLAADDFVASDVPGVPWVYRPSIPDKTNALGLRDAVERSPTKPAGTFRILVLGDSVSSVVVGSQGDPVEQLWPFLTEAELRRQVGPKPRVEVMNLSVPGLSLRQELSLLEARGLDWSPDVVLFAYCVNDPVETPVGRHDNVPGRAVLTMAERELFARQEQQPELWLRPDTPIRKRLEASFERLGGHARSGKVALLVLPVLSDAPGAQSHVKLVHELAARVRVPVLDPTPALGHPLARFKQADSHDVVHFNAAGHRALAALVATALAPIVRGGRWPPKLD